MDAARDTLAEGMRELDFASALEKKARELGHQGILRMRGFNPELFYGHIISGEHSSLMSHLDAPSGGMGVNPSIAQGAGFRKIGRGDPASVDFVALRHLGPTIRSLPTPSRTSLSLTSTLRADRIGTPPVC